MLRNLLRDIYSNKKSTKHNLEAILVPLNSSNPPQKLEANHDDSDQLTFGMELMIDTYLFQNEHDNEHMSLFSALNPAKDVEFSEFSKNNVVSVFLKNVKTSQAQKSSPTISQLREALNMNSTHSFLQQQILSKIQILKTMRGNDLLMNARFSQKQQHFLGMNQNMISHKTVIPSLFELIKNKPSLILHFKKNATTSEKSFHAIHLNKELFNVIEQNPLDFQTSVTVSSLQAAQINIKTSNYLKLIDFFLQSEIEYLNCGQINRKQSDKFDLHLTSSQNKEIELEMQIFQYSDDSDNCYYIFEGLKLKENCFYASSTSSSSLLSRKNSSDIAQNVNVYEPQLRKKKMNNQRQDGSAQPYEAKLQNLNDEFNQKTQLLLESEHIHETSTRTSIDSSSYKQHY